MNKNNLPQIYLGEWLGAWKIQIMRAQFYISMIQLVMIAITAKSQLQAWFPWLSFYLILIILAVAVVLIAIVDYVFVIKSEYSYNSDQLYRHNSPIAIQLNQILEQNKKIMERLNIKE